MQHYAALSNSTQEKNRIVPNLVLRECGIARHHCGMTTHSRGQRTTARITALGIPKRDFAERAGIDRGTLDRALADHPKVSERTWSRIELALTDLEDEIGMAVGGEMVTTTVDFQGATITVQGSPGDVAETVRQILKNA